MERLTDAAAKFQQSSFRNKAWDKIGAGAPACGARDFASQRLRKPFRGRSRSN
jgi:hypothetical protein